MGSGPPAGPLPRPRIGPPVTYNRVRAAGSLFRSLGGSFSPWLRPTSLGAVPPPPPPGLPGPPGPLAACPRPPPCPRRLELARWIAPDGAEFGQLATSVSHVVRCPDLADASTAFQV